MRFTNIIWLFLLPVIFFSCSMKETDGKRFKLIPEKEMVSVLTDLYLADGLLANPFVRIHFTAKDSIINYIEIINQHGFSKEQVDKSLKYYFTEDPKKLQKIYDQVLANLSEIQSGLELATPEPKRINLWNRKEKLSVPEEGAHDLLYFNIPVKDTGLYEISFMAILYNDDTSINPRASAFFWHASDTADGVRDPWDDIALIRDGTRHNYSVSRTLTDTAFTHIRGWLFQCDARAGSWVKHGEFSSISVKKVLRIIK
jgi:hypothetical protein